MKPKFIKIVGMTIALIAFGAVCLVGMHAQQASQKPSPVLVTTNWIGCLVVGEEDPNDPQLSRGPHPSAVRQVEVGLRSDGLLIWRDALPPMVHFRKK